MNWFYDAKDLEYLPSREKKSLEYRFQLWAERMLNEEEKMEKQDESNDE